MEHIISLLVLRRCLGLIRQVMRVFEGFILGSFITLLVVIELVVIGMVVVIILPSSHSPVDRGHGVGYLLRVEFGPVCSAAFLRTLCCSVHRFLLFQRNFL
jgi:hypothetical protein